MLRQTGREEDGEGKGKGILIHAAAGVGLQMGHTTATSSGPCQIQSQALLDLDQFWIDGSFLHH
jgi:hypothetical protein